MRSIRLMALTALTLSAASGAFAAQTTVEFKSFYDNSTFARTPSTYKPGSVASLTLKDVSGGVEGTLAFNKTDFPSGAGGLNVDGLFLSNKNKGEVTRLSGTDLEGQFYKHGFSTDLDFSKKYNYNIDYDGSFAGGATSKFTILGKKVTVDSFLSDGQAKGMLLDIGNVGKPYTGFLGLFHHVHFIGSVVAIPEPSTYALMGLGLVGVMAAARRRTRQA